MILYRPEWTCGRYDRDHDAAIMYNLIEGMAYFFEDLSAMVIGKILSCGKNGSISISALTNCAGISEDNLIPFLDELEKLNLICTSCPSPESINAYRTSLANQQRTHLDSSHDAWGIEDLPVSRNSAEMAYSDRVKSVGGVMFELTYNCSERCIHCYNIGATRNDKEVSHRDVEGYLSLDEYKKIIDDLYDEGVYKVCLTGGDPFSNSLVWDIIEYLSKKDIAIDIYTNGLLLNNNVHRLVNLYPRLVSLSLFSNIAKVHDSITRIPGSWEKTMSVIKQLSSYAIPMNIKCCVMQPNFKSYRGVSEIGKEYGIPVQYELNIVDSIEGDKCASRNLRLLNEQLEIALCDIETPMYVGPEVQNYGEVKRKDNQNGCVAGHDTFNITPDGLLVPCCAFHLELGNFHKESFKDILHNSESLKQWRSLRLSDYAECGKKEYCGFCNLCPGNNHTEHGIPTKCSENNEFMAKARYMLMQKKKMGKDPLDGLSLVEKIEKFLDYEEKQLEREID